MSVCSCICIYTYVWAQVCGVCEHVHVYVCMCTFMWRPKVQAKNHPLLPFHLYSLHQGLSSSDISDMLTQSTWQLHEFWGPELQFLSTHCQNSNPWVFFLAPPPIEAVSLSCTEESQTMDFDPSIASAVRDECSAYRDNGSTTGSQHGFMWLVGHRQSWSSRDSSFIETESPIAHAVFKCYK